MTNTNSAISAFAFLAFALTIIPSAAQQVYEPYTFTTLAGDPGYGSADGTGSKARFKFASGVAVDREGNVYVADSGNSTIRKVNAAGVVTTLAGMAGTSGSADGTGPDARFNYPTGVTVDSTGNIYVADSGSIRKVTPPGVVTTLADSADGKASNSYGVAVDSAGNVYIADLNNTIRKVSAAGVVTTLAGMAGISGSADGTGPNARFFDPRSVAVDNAGNVYVADSVNNTIRKVNAAGVVTTLAGMAGSGGSADGTGSAARFVYPQSVAVDNAGNVYVADYQTIRKVTPAGVVMTLAGMAGSAGSADGTGSAARFSAPTGVAVDSAGNVYVADTGIRKVTPVGVVTTLAGPAASADSTDGTGSVARFSAPTGVVVDMAGNIYVADSANYTIRKVTPAGVVTTLAGLAGSDGNTDGTGSDARFGFLRGLAVDKAGNVYVADTENDTIRKVAPTGVVTTLAGHGPGAAIDKPDGIGSAAFLAAPSGVAVDSTGNVFVADYGDHTIRRVTPAGVVTTVAGLFGSAGNTDGTGSAARFRHPQSLAIDSTDNIYVADPANQSIRKVTPDGVVTTLTAGFGKSDVIPVSGPMGVAVDKAGNVYVADTWNKTIRKVTATGVITTVAGLECLGCGYPDHADGTGSAVRFWFPQGVAVDRAGNVYIADTANNTIRKGFPALAIASSGPDFGFSAGKFGFSFTGPSRQLGVVEASTDLMSWRPIWTNTFAGALHFNDRQIAVDPNRFFRVRMP